VTAAKSLVAGIDQVMSQRDFEPSVELAVFGTAAAARIAAVVNSFCRNELDASVDGCLFYASSQGAVFGLELEDHRRVVLKAHRPERSARFLCEVHQVQRHLAGKAFPCPQPILRARPIGRGLAVVDRFLADGDYVDAHVPAIRKEMARALSSLIRLAEPFASSRDLPRFPNASIPQGSLWRTPHHRMFDFDATQTGAEWIDSAAAAALPKLREGHGDIVVGHSDWSVKDFRFRDGRITAIYDWDSLVVDREPTIVGQAATHFTMTWRMPVRIAPTPAEITAFLAEYEEARGRSFSAAEQRAVNAAAMYSVAYTARCEHALDPTATEYPEGSARELLAAMSDKTALKRPPGAPDPRRGPPPFL
jgi:Ser/Thr protein kinase RdoA (MazF antagonist)